jgi:hypothetical protein
MDLTGSWPYIERIARSRLAHNKTRHHVSEYGEGIETLGVAGELVARRFLGLDEKLHDRFDGGHDFLFAGKTVDVKATVLTPNIAYRYLQWAEWKPVKAQVVLMTGVDPITRQGIVIGYATKEEVLQSPINRSRFNPCHEIPISELHPVYGLVAAHLRFIQRGYLGKNN